MSIRLTSSAPSPSLPSRRELQEVPHPSLSFFPSRRSFTRCQAKKKDNTSFTDRILDYIEGGPKLRRWYGAPDLLPKDGSGKEAQEDDSSDGEEIRDAVLVTDGESEMGQMVILLLIVKRVRIKALVKDKRAALDAFGTYVEPVAGDANEKSFLKKALKGVNSIIYTEHDGFLSKVKDWRGIEHIVMLSQLAVYRGSTGLQAMINGSLKKIAERDEELVISSGIPYTIIRTGSLQSTPGGQQGFSFEEGVAEKERMSKEDAARICTEALGTVPRKGLIVEVANGEEQVPDWKAWFEEQLKIAEQQQ
ncbi:NAD(P)-binding Rossmann-fold superfamily protein [Rhynchospora pubera]|uniref:NAD(P)-binding Rossmann-fold superfamily protein n=1 Tax=Rhynchospora pubera TaxID=906938 RepID=A0AAV8D2K3_9POAL|nr:NAD(P)-binding Rossmann-fold superfamily protein [Rhynchospora pubera]